MAVTKKHQHKSSSDGKLILGDIAFMKSSSDDLNDVVSDVSKY